MKTNTESLANLFDNFADELAKLLKQGKTIVDKEGEIQQVTPDAATFNVIRQFLKDTGTTIAPNSNPKVNSIADSLPFDGSEYAEDASFH
jgi:archaellum component FlaG (FlaF/FlaG flagellin family)